MNSYHVTAAIAVDRSNTLIAEAANARLVKAAQRAAGRPAATPLRSRWNPFRRFQAATA